MGESKSVEAFVIIQVGDLRKETKVMLCPFIYKVEMQ